MSNENQVALKEENKKIVPTTEIQKRYQEAQYLAQSDLLPKHFAGKPANCLIALEYAKQLSTVSKSLSPISVMQNLYVVKGNVGLSSKFIIALANSSGKFDHPLLFDVDKSNKSNLSVKCFSKICGQDVSYTVDMEMAKAEGWTSNPKYKTMPELMLRYRSASFLVRTCFPEVIMGLNSDDDVRDIIQAEILPSDEEKQASAEKSQGLME